MGRDMKRIIIRVDNETWQKWEDLLAEMKADYAERRRSILGRLAKGARIEGGGDIRDVCASAPCRKMCPLE